MSETIIHTSNNDVNLTYGKLLRCKEVIDEFCRIDFSPTHTNNFLLELYTIVGLDSHIVKSKLDLLESIFNVTFSRKPGTYVSLDGQLISFTVWYQRISVSVIFDALTEDLFDVCIEDFKNLSFGSVGMTEATVDKINIYLIISGYELQISGSKIELDVLKSLIDFGKETFYVSLPNRRFIVDLDSGTIRITNTKKQIRFKDQNEILLFVQLLSNDGFSEELFESSNDLDELMMKSL